MPKAVGGNRPTFSFFLLFFVTMSETVGRDTFPRGQGVVFTSCSKLAVIRPRHTLIQKRRLGGWCAASPTRRTSGPSKGFTAERPGGRPEPFCFSLWGCTHHISTCGRYATHAFEKKDKRTQKAAPKSHLSRRPSCPVGLVCPAYEENAERLSPLAPSSWCDGRAYDQQAYQ